VLRLAKVRAPHKRPKTKSKCRVLEREPPDAIWRIIFKYTTWRIIFKYTTYSYTNTCYISAHSRREMNRVTESKTSK
jgi:hypothetical protein